MMHHNVLTGNKKGFLLKIIFFLGLLTTIALIYMESKMAIDALYFIVVFVLFIRFLFIKLYP